MQIVTIALVVSAILLVTLSPSGNRAPAPFAFGFSLGRRSMSDAVLNFLLFLPLGIAIAWRGRGVIAAGAFAFLLASIIEVAQTFVPGRDPALSDIIVNTAGAVAGAVMASWRHAVLGPDAVASRRLSLITLSLAAAIMVATTYLLAPMPAENHRAFIGRSGDDLVLRYASRGSTWGFDQPEYWHPATFRTNPNGKPASVSVTRDRSRWKVAFGNERATLGPTVGQGWALLAYPDDIARRWGIFVSGLWLFGIFVPVGFGAGGKLRWIAAGIGLLLLAVLPVITGVVATKPHEWAGALAGFAAGTMLGFSRRPRRS